MHLLEVVNMSPLTPLCDKGCVVFNPCLRLTQQQLRLDPRVSRIKINWPTRGRETDWGYCCETNIIRMLFLSDPTFPGMDRNAVNSITNIIQVLNLFLINKPRDQLVKPVHSSERLAHPHKYNVVQEAKKLHMVELNISPGSLYLSQTDTWASIYPSIYPAIHLSMYPSIYPSIRPSIHLPCGQQVIPYFVVGIFFEGNLIECACASCYSLSKPQ